MLRCAFLDARTSPASSELALAETPRAIRRAAVGDPATDAEALFADIQSVLAGLVLMHVGRDVLAAAGAIEAPLLRALDAIHVATALAIGDSRPPSSATTVASSPPSARRG